MPDDALICVSVSSSGPRGEGMENNTKLSKRNATVKKIANKSNKVKKESEKQIK